MSAVRNTSQIKEGPFAEKRNLCSGCLVPCTSATMGYDSCVDSCVWTVGQLGGSPATERRCFRDAVISGFKARCDPIWRESLWWGEIIAVERSRTHHGNIWKDVVVGRDPSCCDYRASARNPPWQGASSAGHCFGVGRCCGPRRRGLAERNLFWRP